MRVIDGNTIETECDSCACTFTCGRGEDGEPDEILCSECKRTWQDLRAELAKERDRVWFETFLQFPFKALPAPTQRFTDAELAAIDLDDTELHRCRQCRRWTDSVETVCSSCNAAAQVLANLDWAEQQAQEAAKWREHQHLMDAADQAAYYSPRWPDE